MTVAIALASAAPTHADVKEPTADPLAAPRRDPNDAPFLNPRAGGARADGNRIYDADHSPKYGNRQRFRLTVKPLYASLRVALAGRSNSALDPKRGGGLGLDVELPVWRPVWFRVTGSYTAHDLQREFSRNEDGDFVLSAPKGRLHIAYAAAALGYTMDRGRLQPTLEVGLGPMWARGPRGVQNGQVGQACIGGNACEFGLACDTAANVCRPATTFAVHGGLGLDLELGRRWSLGAGLRYFAFLSSPAAYPIYLQASARLGFRL